MTPVRPGWFGSRNSAVSLTFDDGMDSHRGVVVPALDARGMAGTFYVKTDDADRLRRFREAQRRGHEIGNHTVHHWCSRAHRPEADATGLEDLTLDDMAAELDESDRRLRAAFPDVESFSFCYPCYDTFVGHGPARRSYVPLVAGRFGAARGGGEISTPYNSPVHADLWCLRSVRCEFNSAEQLIAAVERGRELAMWTILTFHGVDEGHLPVTGEDFGGLLDHLAGRSDELWVAPLIQVAQSIAATREGTRG
ncbi:MAG: polysaccharide deacetylase family protein [Spirochaetaceae bacterium]|nr:polysaccharide deacetylase family protein [Spirochaetaceae bacterium]